MAEDECRCFVAGRCWEELEGSITFASTMIVSSRGDGDLIVVAVGFLLMDVDGAVLLVEEPFHSLGIS